MKKAYKKPEALITELNATDITTAAASGINPEPTDPTDP